MKVCEKNKNQNKSSPPRRAAWGQALRNQKNIERLAKVGGISEEESWAEGGVELLTEERVQTKRPKLYCVVMLNDDYTPHGLCGLDHTTNLP